MLIYLANFSTSLISRSSNYTSLLGKGASGYTFANGSQEARLLGRYLIAFYSWSWPYGCKYKRSHISTGIEHRKNASIDSASCCRLRILGKLANIYIKSGPSSVRGIQETRRGARTIELLGAEIGIDFADCAAELRNGGLAIYYFRIQACKPVGGPNISDELPREAMPVDP